MMFMKFKKENIIDWCVSGVDKKIPDLENVNKTDS